jgi:hypothetical protein
MRIVIGYLFRLGTYEGTWTLATRSQPAKLRDHSGARTRRDREAPQRRGHTRRHLPAAQGLPVHSRGHLQQRYGGQLELGRVRCPR